MARDLTRRLTATMVAGGVLLGGLLGATPAEAATVTGTAITRVSIRVSPSSSAFVLGTMDKGQRLPTTTKPAKGWVKVRFLKGSAYVAASQLNLTGKDRPSTPTKISTSGTKVATGTLNVRSAATGSASLVGRIAEGSSFALTGKLSNRYAQISYAKKLRWVSLQHLAALQPRSAGVVAFAKKQLGASYKYGGTGPTAYDCSGLTQAAWKAVGVSLPRTSQQQFAVGKKIAKADLRPGDLVFFYSQRPTHVGIYVGDGLLIHAPGSGKKVAYIKLSYMPFSGARRPG